MLFRSGKNFIEDPGLHRSLLGDGLATTMAALFGAPANTTYGENTGVLALTRVYNPAVVRMAAVLAVIFSFCPKFEELIHCMPAATIGGVSSMMIHYKPLNEGAETVLTVNGDAVTADEYSGYMLYNMQYYASMYAQMGLTDLWSNEDMAKSLGASMPEAAEELSYFLRFVPLVRGGYALAIVVGWLSYNKASGLFVSYLTMLLATVYFSSLIFFVLEHKVNPLVANYGDALWWAFMDVTTVGSNISAITVTGRVLSVVLAALGMMMFPIFTVYVTSLVQKSNEEKKRFYENIQAPSPQPEVKDK